MSTKQPTQKTYHIKFHWLRCSTTALWCLLKLEFDLWDSCQNFSTKCNGLLKERVNMLRSLERGVER